MKTRTIGLLTATLLILAACGGGEGQTDTTAVPTQEATTTAAEETTTTAEEMMSGVHIAETDLGSILVDAEGFTLYIFTNDTEGESVCYDACADLWPPVPADTPVSSDLDESRFGSTTRDDGSEQLTVNAMPLYLYTPDTSPGDTTGQGFNDVWFVVDADGNMLEAAGSSDVVDDYDY